MDMIGRDGESSGLEREHGTSGTGVLVLDAAHRDRLAQWARAAYPHEACGLLLGHAGPEAVRIERVEPARNLERERPRTHYTLSPEDQVRIERQARAAGLEIVGIWHSHPDSPPAPSRADVEGAYAGQSYLILSTEGSEGSSAVPFRSWRLQRTGFAEQPIEVRRTVR